MPTQSPHPPTGAPHSAGPVRRFAPSGSVDTAPRIVSLSPDNSRTSGGGTLTITGLNFRVAPDGTQPVVTIGGATATSVAVVNPTTVTCVIPAGAAGLSDVTVAEGSQSYTAPNAFTYFGAAIVSVSPGYTPFGGGADVVIFGYNFIAGATIAFGGIAATNVVFIDSQHYSATVPAHAVGFVDVTMTEPLGAVWTLKRGFQYTLFNRGNDIRRSPGIKIHSALGQQKTATITIDGSSNKPLVGERIEVTDSLDGDRLLFAGLAEKVTQRYDDGIDAYFWDVTCSGWASLFNKYRPIASFTNVSATTVVTSLVGQFAPSFTTAHVQTNLARISIDLDGTKELYACLQDIAKMIGGGHVWVDDYQDVHFFHVVPPGIPPLDIPQQPPMTVGPAAAPTVAEASSDWPDSFTGGYVAVAASFVYEGGAESIPGPLSPFAAMCGDRRWDISNIPVGSPVGGKNVIARRLYFKAFAYSGETPFTKYLEIPDNTTTAVKGHGYTALASDLSPATFVSPPGVGGFNGTGTGLPAGWSAGETLLIRFTVVNANGQTTMGSSVAFVLGAVGPRIAAPSTMPAGGNTFACYASRDGGATYHAIAAGLYANQAFLFVTPKTLFDTFPTPPSVNTAAITSGHAQTAWAFDGVPYVAPPAGPTSAPTGAQGAGSPVAGSNVFMTYPPNPPFTRSAASPYTFTPGWFQLRYSYFYANGVVTKPSPASAPFQMDGLHPYSVSDLVLGPTVSGIPVLGVVFWADYLGFSSATERPANDTSQKTMWFVSGNTATSYETTPFGFVGSFPKSSTDDELVWPNPDGPDLEDTTAPDDIDDNNHQVLHMSAGQGFELDEDRTQLWNRVRVFGAGSTTTAAAAVNASTIQVADLTPFNARGGQIIVKGQVLKYFGLTAVSGKGSLYISSTTPVPVAVPSGSAVLAYYQADDVDSQRAIGAVELDKNGNKTDGVYETVVIDSSLTKPIQLFMKAYGTLERYAWPVKTIRYSTRDPKTAPGRIVHVDLTTPPCKGDFLIQAVDIDQARDDGDAVAPRYTATASSVHFELDDFLIMLLDRNPTQTTNVVGVVDSAVAQSVAGTTLTSISGTLTGAQVQSMATTPVTVVAGVAGQVLCPVAVYVKSIVTLAQATSAGVGLKYHGRATTLCGPSGNWNQSNTQQFLPVIANDGGNGGTTIAGLGLDLVGNFNGNSVGNCVFTYTVVYYTVPA